MKTRDSNHSIFLFYHDNKRIHGEANVKEHRNELVYVVKLVELFLQNDHMKG